MARRRPGAGGAQLGAGLAQDGPSWPVLRCLAVADREERHPERAADRYTLAFDDLCREADDAEGSGPPPWPPSGGRRSRRCSRWGARRTPGRWERLDPGTRARGRFRLIEAGLLLAEGRNEEARAVFDAGFEVADLREGDEVIGRLWARLTDEPLPQRYDFGCGPHPDLTSGAAAVRVLVDRPVRVACDQVAADGVGSGPARTAAPISSST